jgi:hypothetical protein
VFRRAIGRIGQALPRSRVVCGGVVMQAGKVSASGVRYRVLLLSGASALAIWASAAAPASAADSTFGGSVQINSFLQVQGRPR